MPAKPLSAIASAATFTLSLQAHALAGVVISGDYYEQASTFVACQSANYCRVDLDRIPADKLLDVQHVNCYVQSSQAIRTAGMGSSSASGGSTARFIYFPFQINATGGGNYYYLVNEPVNYRIGASPYLFFAVETFASAQIGVSCIATGRLSPR